MPNYETCEAAAAELMAGWRHWEGNDLEGCNLSIRRVGHG
jgi:hypothetical protein